MIENRKYVGPFFEMDKQRRIRTWPSFGGPEPEEILPGWQMPVSDEPLERLVEPAPLVDTALLGW